MTTIPAKEKRYSGTAEEFALLFDDLSADSLQRSKNTNRDTKRAHAEGEAMAYRIAARYMREATLKGS